jgi:hypothetical protein
MSGGRTVIVGDVHGCRRELEQLLDKVAFATGDRLVFVGDLVARGPDSLGVLDIVRRTGALVVRGNHEQKLLAWKDARVARLRGEDAREVKLGDIHARLASTLRPVDWSLFDTSLFWLDLPEHGVRVVHAGVVPGVAIDRIKPSTLMRIRTVRDNGRPSDEGQEGGVLWGSRYTGPPHVVFGHNAAPGLQLHRWATGLDTGCVYGGRLTSLVLAEKQKVPMAFAARRLLLVSIPAARVYFEPAHAKRARRVA